MDSEFQSFCEEEMAAALEGELHAKVYSAGGAALSPGLEGASLQLS